MHLQLCTFSSFAKRLQTGPKNLSWSPKPWSPPLFKLHLHSAPTAARTPAPSPPFCFLPPASSSVSSSLPSLLPCLCPYFSPVASFPFSFFFFSCVRSLILITFLFTFLLSFSTPAIIVIYFILQWSQRKKKIWYYSFVLFIHSFLPPTLSPRGRGL